MIRVAEGRKVYIFYWILTNVFCACLNVLHKQITEKCDPHEIQLGVLCDRCYIVK